MIPVSVNGKVYFCRDIDELLDLDYQELIANDVGMTINDPFFNSVIHLDRHGRPKDNSIDTISFDIPDISEIEEINSQD